MSEASHEKIVNHVVDTLTETLNAEETFFSSDEIVEAVLTVSHRNAPTITTNPDTPVNLEQYFASLTDIEDFTNQIRNELLLSIAEERPGTIPWEHEPTIPLPIVILSSLNHTLSVCGSIALTHNEPRWTQHALDTLSDIANLTTEQLSQPQLEDTPTSIPVLFGVGHLQVPGPIIYLPQPGVAATARYIENVIHRLATGTDWNIPAELGVTNDSLCEILSVEARRLRDLNERYGQQSGPRHLS
jgi:hypothetical protein